MSIQVMFEPLADMCPAVNALPAKNNSKQDSVINRAAYRNRRTWENLLHNMNAHTRTHPQVEVWRGGAVHICAYMMSTAGYTSLYLHAKMLYLIENIHIMYMYVDLHAWLNVQYNLQYIIACEHKIHATLFTAIQCTYMQHGLSIQRIKSVIRDLCPLVNCASIINSVS